jgi:hypothetical protein
MMMTLATSMTKQEQEQRHINYQTYALYSVTLEYPLYNQSLLQSPTPSSLPHSLTHSLTHPHLFTPPPPPPPPQSRLYSIQLSRGKDWGAWTENRILSGGRTFATPQGERFKGFTQTYLESSAAFDPVSRKAYLYGGWHPDMCVQIPRFLCPHKAPSFAPSYILDHSVGMPCTDPPPPPIACTHRYDTAVNKMTGTQTLLSGKYHDTLLEIDVDRYEIRAVEAAGAGP